MTSWPPGSRVQALPFGGGLLGKDAGLLVTGPVFQLQALSHTTHCPSWAPSSQMAGQGRAAQGLPSLHDSLPATHSKPESASCQSVSPAPPSSQTPASHPSPFLE